MGSIASARLPDRDERARDAAFGALASTPAYARLIALAQRAPENALGKQFARLLCSVYLRFAPLPADVVVERLRMRCWLRDNTCERKFVFTPWRFDALERRALAAALPVDGVFIDIGANVGIHTLSAALRLGDSGRVIAFEPHPAARARLAFNIAATRAGLGAWPRIDVLPIGVSDSAGRFELRIDAGNLGGGSIVEGDARFSAAGSVDRVIIECRPLLSLLKEQHVARIDALKIDIEGAEDRALVPFLEAAPDSLLPRCLVIENSDRLWKRDLRGAISKRGLREMLRTRLNTVYER